MSVGEVIVTIVAILVGGALGFALLVLAFGDKLAKQEMEDRLDKECAKDREKLIKKKAEEKKEKREQEKKNSKIAYQFEAASDSDTKDLDGYMEVFPELPKKTQKKKTTKKSSTKKVTK